MAEELSLASLGAGMFPQFQNQSLANLGQQYQAMKNTYPAANIAPPSPRGFDVSLPNVSVENFGPGRPRLGANMGFEFGGGNLGVEGKYQRRDDFSPAEWSAMLNYRRQF